MCTNTEKKGLGGYTPMFSTKGEFCPLRHFWWRVEEGKLIMGQQSDLTWLSDLAFSDTTQVGVLQNFCHCLLTVEF